PQVHDGSTLIASMCCWPCCANQKVSPRQHSLTWASTAELSNEHFGKRSAATKRPQNFRKPLKPKAPRPRNGSITKSSAPNIFSWRYAKSGRALLLIFLPDSAHSRATSAKRC